MQTHSARAQSWSESFRSFEASFRTLSGTTMRGGTVKGIQADSARRSIPLASRIILMSDTIDAMTTDRPYRKRLGLEVVVNELQKCKGTQFDPEKLFM